jgi:4,5-dihydroxyphthalate decarboxylase
MEDQAVRGIDAPLSRAGARVFYGWWVVLACFVGLTLGAASILVFSLGVFTKPIEDEFGWTRAQVSLAAAVIVYTIVLVGPLQGYLIDRFGVRRVALPSIPLFAAALALLYFLPANLAVFYAAWVAVTICGAGVYNASFNKVTAAWFDRRLGLAVGIVSAGQGFGAALIPPISQWLVAGFGWRFAYVGLALIVLVIGLPVIALLLRDKPEDKGLLPDGDSYMHGFGRMFAAGPTLREALRLKSFWIVAAAFFLLGIMSTAIVSHLVPMLVDGGLAPQSAAYVQSAFGVALIVGRLTVGVLLDRFFAPSVMIASLLGPVLGLTMYALGAGGGAVFLWAFITGFGVGAEFDVLGYLIPRYFGRRSYGKMYGVLLSGFLLGGGVGAALLGVIRTAYGSYTIGLWGIVAATAAAALLFARLGPYAYVVRMPGKPVKPAGAARAGSDLPINLACWNYDRTRALIDGTVRPEGIDLTYNDLFVADIFQRMVRDREFDASELGLTFYLASLDLPEPPFIALPIFPLRFFRHAAIFVNTKSGIRTPQDLAGRRVGELFTYGHDAGIWAKGILSDDYGVRADSYSYHVGGIDRFVPEWDWFPAKPPAHVRVEQLGPGQSLDAMLEAGEIDALFSAIMPPSLLKGSPNVRRLFEDYETVGRDYYRRTGIFPIMHTFVLRRDVYRRNPWIAQSLYTAFKEAKRQALLQYEAGDAFMHGSFMVPWFTTLRDENRRMLGEDPYPYGVEANRTTLEAFLRYHHEQGLTRRLYKPEEIFAPETLAD